ncbi:MAG TPA: hypothetical protein VEN81_07355 [Planctomycetota bacterium]|jgi:hypothetical protein|nr:hypothetical protein [Planctomycetota bacterium]
MGDWKDAVLFPLRAAGAVAKITGRVTIGIVGFLMMGGGLFLLSPLHYPWVGLPVLAVGLLLLVRAVF